MPRHEEHSPPPIKRQSDGHTVRNEKQHEKRNSEIRSPTKATQGHQRVTNRQALTALRRRSQGPGRGRYERKPLTPTTRLEILKERRHRAYERKRAEERRRAMLLGREETYWRVLRSGARYRSFGGAKAG
ncbi:hypothetical protein EJ03DRAFT_79216 [Teratosphaeria nubilosa]|uniref:Uncharacterized protein n=1 Tax=Teratosphaeria nubilosa TaxID=161662 RepID=A0A6G1LBT9_9PEZI|nr:hypothetical protein EJ03DRAFT_79216 [Teratosphaeria nubilosa]